MEYGLDIFCMETVCPTGNFPQISRDFNLSKKTIRYVKVVIHRKKVEDILLFN